LYATHVHSGQVRKETTIPYIAHLLAVAATVLEYGGSEDMVRNRFGDRVADICARGFIGKQIAAPSPHLSDRDRR
jgi:hypothetical protein